MHDGTAVVGMAVGTAAAGAVAVGAGASRLDFHLGGGAAPYMAMAAPPSRDQPLGSPCVEMGAGLLLSAPSSQKENGRALPGGSSRRVRDQNASYCWAGK